MPDIRSTPLRWLFLAWGVLFFFPSFLKAGVSIRVGIYQNPPLVSFEDPSRPQGIYIDILEHIAGDEGWDLIYSPCKWKDCLRMLQQGEIDIQTAIGYSPERAKRIAFTEEDMLVNWAVIYRHPDSAINALPDLDGKNIAVLEGDIYSGPFLELMDAFDLSPSIIRLQSYDQIFQAVSDGRADAGLLNRLYGRLNNWKYPLVEQTDIIFSPIRIKFGLPKRGRLTSRLVKTLDQHLRDLKKKKDSIYYRSLDRWLGVPERTVTPGWLPWAAGAVGGLILFFLGMNCFLRVRIKAATEELRSRYEQIDEMREYLEAIYRATPDMIFIHDSMGRVVDINENVARTFGYSLDEIRNMPPEDMMGEGYTFDMAMERIKKTLEGAPQEFKWSGRKKDGIEFPVEVRLRRIELRNREGEREPYVLAIVRDLTREAEAKERVRRSEEWFRTIFESEPECVKILTPEGRLIDMNPAGLRMIEVESIGEVRGQSILPFIEEGFREEFSRFTKQVAEGESGVLEFRIQGLQGTPRWMESHAVPLSDERGERMVLAITRDITERKRTEAELEALVSQRTEELNERIREVETLNRAMLNLLEDFQTANRKLETLTDKLKESNRELEAYAYSVSHDLRGPLRAMQGFSEALLEDYGDVLDDEGRDYAERIASAARRMDGLINDLLQYSRISRRDFHLQPVSLERILDSVIQNLRHSIEEQNARLEVRRPLPEVMGSRSILEQVLTNLISNALKFVKEGERPVVKIWAEEGEGFQRLNVEDKGIGIPEEHQERIFQVFERLHGMEEYPGTGIGLAIVKKGVERLGGRVWVESAAGGGSRFWIDLIKYKNRAAS
jgi:PAS domain S-box-containing protein